MKKWALMVSGVLCLGLCTWMLFTPVGGPETITPRLVDFLRLPGPGLKVPEGAMQVAVASLAPARDKATNLAEIERISRQAKTAHRDLDLIVFGEATLGLYNEPESPAAYQRAQAEAVPGPSSRKLSELAKELGVYLAYGFVEAAGDTLFNSMVLLSPEGEILARHRKMLLHWLDKLGGMSEAEPNYQVVNINGLRVGLSICADANSRWLLDRYREEEIDILLYSVTSKVPPTVKILRYWPYAKIYDAWILAANRSGVEGNRDYPGTVFVADPTGRVVAVDDVNDGFIVANVGR